MTDPSANAPPHLLVAGVAQFNRGEYYEQHETLETLWRAERRPIRRLYQGILQIGVAFHHLRRGNHHGAVVLIERGLANVRPFGPACGGLDIDTLIRDTTAAQQAIAALGPRRLDEFDWSRAPHVHWLDGR
jgi:predicted metal-dependent hydrolase